ncbi:MAG TPA: HD domain-containing protein [Candidatus Thermoplasmatota archaeon]|nr:HD domain-containing protein [Candidatus Thermoplasmatota archaeon]
MQFAERVRARIAPVYEGMSPYDPCHDLFHVDRVARNARMLAKLEGADEDVCAAAAYLHDLDRAGSTDTLRDAREHLAAVGAPEAYAARVLEAVERHKDKSFAPGGKRPMSLEAQVVGDADKLEAIGAIGIARAFSFGGLKGRALWDGADTTAADVYVSGRMGTTIQHFYDKLLRLQADFNTASGRKLGEERTAFLRAYLDQFFAEWHATQR